MNWDTGLGAADADVKRARTKKEIYEYAWEDDYLMTRPSMFTSVISKQAACSFETGIY